MRSYDYDIGIIGGGAAGLTVTSGAIHVYPTLAEIPKQAAGGWFAAKLFSNRTRRILHCMKEPSIMWRSRSTCPMACHSSR